MRWQTFTPVRNANGENCGTGAGGFKPGNDCAKRAGPKPRPRPKATSPQGDTKESMAHRLGMYRSSTNRSYYENTWSYHASGRVRGLAAAERIIKNALAEGFVLEEEGRLSHDGWIKYYSHPDGHTLQVFYRPNDGATAHLEFVAYPHREGYRLSSGAMDATRATHSSANDLEYAAADNALYRAKQGQHATASYDHDRAARFHLEAAEVQGRHNHSWAKSHRDAAAAHMVASDYHKERAGLQ